MVVNTNAENLKSLYEMSKVTGIIFAALYASTGLHDMLQTRQTCS